MSSQSEWQKVTAEALGKGGQSTVYLVRTPERVTAREKSFAVLKALSGQGLNEERAIAFSRAAADIAREDFASELGALKIFEPRAIGPNPKEEAIGRLRNEIAVLKENRPGLVKLLDSNESENWIVTEFMPKGTLDRHLARYVGNVKAAMSAFLPLVQTVLALHKDKIVHRDIKPQNIFAGEHDELILGDLGLVFLPDKPERLSFTNEMVGPWDFMPPWVALDEHPTIRPSFDVYMLGKVLWCMVTGRMKLHREDFLDSRFDVTALFPEDPNMGMVNTILKKCVVPREKDCLSSAQDLLLMVSKFSQMLERGGQLFGKDVIRLCRVCGAGIYHPPKAFLQEAEVFLHLWVDGKSSAQLSVRPMECDTCGHLQLFRPRST